MRSLVLVGHGSHLNSLAAQTIYHLAEQLRAQNLVHEVVEAFWKDEPSLRQVMRVTGSTDVTVIPMFLSAGYFTEVVIPRELGLGHQGPVATEGIARVISGKTVRYLPPYGAHPGMSEVIRRCALDHIHPVPPAETALVILGHGAGRQNTQPVLESHAQTLKATGEFVDVQVLFLNEDTQSGEWLKNIQAARIVVVPFLSAAPVTGLWAALGLPSPNQAGPQRVHISPPVGAHPGVLDVLVQITQYVRQTNEFSGDIDRTHLNAWTNFMQLARRGLRLGEVLITPQSHLFDVRNTLDEGKASTELITYVTPDGLRDASTQDDAGQHRPVRSMRTLPRGWRGVFSEDDLPRAIHNLYPAAVEEAYACGGHTLRSTPWPTTARRQTGNYARVQKATPAQVNEIARQVCSGCLRRRLWAGEALPNTFLNGVPGGIPCAEACTYFIAQVRDHLSEQ